MQDFLKADWKTYYDVLQAVLYPMRYHARYLIMMGYEPLPPQERINLWGNSVQALPNIIQYVSYIASVGGYTGCYRGVFPAFLSYAAYQAVQIQARKMYPPEEEAGEDGRRYKAILRNLWREIAIRIVAIIASQPFHVIALRTIAQIAGRETRYDTFVLASAVKVCLDSGLLGLFSGLVPMLIGEIGPVVVKAGLNELVHLICTVREREHQLILDQCWHMIGNRIFFQFRTVAANMAVNDCGLALGQPPLSPIYKDWVECWRYLSASKQMRRRNTTFRRRLEDVADQPPKPGLATSSSSSLALQ